MMAKWKFFAASAFKKKSAPGISVTAFARGNPRMQAKIAFALLAAPLWRRLLRKTVFIGVTGSCGKTTAKDFIHAVLSSQHPTHRSHGSFNTHIRVAFLLMRIRPADRFVVQELGANYPGYLRKSLRILRPQVGVVTVIGLDHFRAFRTKEKVAEEKGALIARLPADGVAVLNADDPLVLAMRERTRARCVTYGLAEAADVRASDVAAAWPDRLHFTVSYQGETLPVRTQMCGALLLPSVLAGLATGVALGIPLAAAIRAAEGVKPEPGRMYPVSYADGVAFIRDDWKSSLWSIPLALAFMGEARAGRKIVLMGTISDYGGSGSQRKYPAVARDAAAVADHVFFIGPQARLALKAASSVDEGRVRAFETAREAADFLRGFLRSGDLVLVKASNPADHLARIALDRQAPIVCWRTDCDLSQMCDYCPQLRAGA